MKKYIEPSIKVLKVDSVDIIQTSNLSVGDNFDTEGGSGTLPDIVPTNTFNQQKLNNMINN